VEHGHSELAQILRLYETATQRPLEKAEHLHTTYDHSFFVSAIWHGFYFGFFVFFFSLGILDYMYKLGREILVPLLSNYVPQRLAIFFLWVHCYANCAYFGMSHLLVEHEKSMRFYRGVNFALHIALVASIGALLLVKKVVGGKVK